MCTDCYDGEGYCNDSSKYFVPVGTAIMCGDNERRVCSLPSATSDTTTSAAETKIAFVQYTLSLAGRIFAVEYGTFNAVALDIGSINDLVGVSGVCAEAGYMIGINLCLQVGGLSSTANECLQNPPVPGTPVQHFYADSEYTQCTRLEYEVRPS